MPYRAPVDDIIFLLEEVTGFSRLREASDNEAAASDMVGAILKEAGAMCENVIVPLQRPGDIHPARLENGVVRTAPGFSL